MGAWEHGSMGAWEHENMGGMIRMDDMERLERIEDEEEKLEMGVVNEGELEEGRRKKRPNKEYRDMLNRLSRIEGQVRGIKRMVEEDVYCTDILVQVAAINAALNSFNKVLLANHIRTCVAQDIREGKEETIDELVKTLQKLMK